MEQQSTVTKRIGPRPGGMGQESLEVVPIHHHGSTCDALLDMHFGGQTEAHQGRNPPDERRDNRSLIDDKDDPSKPDQKAKVEHHC